MHFVTGRVIFSAVNVIKALFTTLLVLAVFAGLGVMYFKIATLPMGPSLSNDAYLSIMLTAVGVIVATFAIFVGLAAIWGYAGLKDTVRDMATKEVDKAVKNVLKKYPPAADMLRVMKRLQDQADLLDQLRNQAATERPEAKTVAPASKASVQGGVAGGPATPLDSIEQQTTPIEEYPGEEDGHAASDSDADKRSK